MIVNPIELFINVTFRTVHQLPLHVMPTTGLDHRGKKLLTVKAGVLIGPPLLEAMLHVLFVNFASTDHVHLTLPSATGIELLSFEFHIKYMVLDVVSVSSV
jgi:hypothetical protein